jgi:hypothetical protein
MNKGLDTIVVFTARSPARILREGGSQAWKLDPIRAKKCVWLVCTQNQHNVDTKFSDATEPHGSAFLLGKISSIRQSSDPGDEGRWLIAIDEFARINIPDVWKGWRNPVKYLSLNDLQTDATSIEFQSMPERDASDDEGVSPVRGMHVALTIAEAKKALALTFGVKPEAIEITVRG